MRIAVIGAGGVGGYFGGRLAAADNEVKCGARSVLHKNCESPDVIDDWHQWLLPPFPVGSDKARSPIRTQLSATRALTPEKIPETPGSRETSHLLSTRVSSNASSSLRRTE